jgi:16S rRNA (guanine(527)-N(7))-methyltransferase RsmG
MGQFTEKKEGDSIRRVFDRIGCGDPGARARLERYAFEIVHWNARVNLTGAGTAAAFIEGPLFDALTLIPVLERFGALVDVGSVGGLPGIPAAILLPGIAVTLVEPRAKRAAFLRHAVDRLGLKSAVVEARDETLQGAGWRGAVAQAVWPPEKWLARGLRLVEPGGAIYLLSSKPLRRSELPEKTAVETEKHFVRPFDNAKRYSARIRVV